MRKRRIWRERKTKRWGERENEKERGRGRKRWRVEQINENRIENL